MRIRRGFDEEPELNLIPLIDVLLIVLIFLAVTTTYSRYAQLQIELPTANAERPDALPTELHVGVTAAGRYAIDQAVVPYNDVASLAQGLKAAAQGRGERVVLVINADAQAPHQAVITVMQAARDAGLARISFATQREPGSR